MREIPIGLLGTILEVFFDSPSLELAAQRLVQDPELVPGGPEGAFIFKVTNKSELRLAAGFGTAEITECGTLSIWEDHPLAQACQSRTPLRHIHETGAGITQNLILLPLLRGRLAAGILVIRYRQLPEIDQAEPVWSVISSVGGYFLATQGLDSNRSETAGNPSPQDLSARQLEILRLMSAGLNNNQISQRVLVSASTVRQETIRIYRALQVPNRHEASLKGKAIGLIAAD
jgi:DNA-binding CsgD family transcriptional regulator